jgi:hypothetical protein
VIQVAPAQPIRSLREDTRAHALRRARTCYDHFAGKLGVALMAALLERGVLTGGDGRYDPERAERDLAVGPGHDVDYRLGPEAPGFLERLGVTPPPARTAVRYCVDWTEQRHHLSGGYGRALQARLVELDWVRRSPGSRAVVVTDAGRDGLAERFGVEL